MGRLGDGGVEHQESADRRGRRHQDRRLLCQGQHEERDRHQRRLAELCDVRRQRLGYQSVGFGATTDGVYLPGAGGTGGIVLTTAWGVRGAFNHNWNPNWSTSLFGSYAAVRYDGSATDGSTAKGAYCAAFGVSHPGQAAGAYTCNPDFNVSQLGVVTRWTPVKNLTFSGEVQWFHLDQKMAGSSVFAPSAPKPSALYEFKDQDTVLLQFRAQRNF